MQTGKLKLRLLTVLAWLSINTGTYYRSRDQVVPVSVEPTKPVVKRSHPVAIEQVVVQTALEHPMLGYKKVHYILKTRKGIRINKKAVYRILAEHKLLKSRKKRQKEIRDRYRRKLRELLPTGINQVWQMDVTYVYIEGNGFYFLIDIQDYYSKYVLAQRLCYSYSAKEGIETLKRAIEEAERLVGKLQGPIHLITDNGTTFIAKFFANKVKQYQIGATEQKLFDHIRIGYRMPQHIGSIERYHGNLKQECVYLNWFLDPIEAEKACTEYAVYYNYERPHWAHKLKTPAEVYLSTSYSETLAFKPIQETPRARLAQ